MVRIPVQNIATWVLSVTLFVLGLSGLVGGYGLMSDPTGRKLDLPSDWLSGSIFDDYLIPGLYLFFALGLIPCVAAFGLFRQNKWSEWLSIAIGIVLIIWIIVEIQVVGFHSKPPLQTVYGIMGVFITLLGSGVYFASRKAVKPGISPAVNSKGR